MRDLEGRVIAIAGAAGGLGPSVAKRLAEGGATIAATDVAQERLDQLGADLVLSDQRFDGRVVDLLDEQASGGWAADLRDRFGRVDCLLHLIGGWRGGAGPGQGPPAKHQWGPQSP